MIEYKILNVFTLLALLLLIGPTQAENRVVVVPLLGSDAAGLKFIDSFVFNATTPLGTSQSPAAPTGYTVTASLTAGRYYVSGDTTIKNQNEANGGVAHCRLWVASNSIGLVAMSSLPVAAESESFANLSYATSFTISADASTDISFRCYLTGTTTNAVYWLGNMTLFKLE